MESDDSNYADNIYNRIFAAYQWKPIRNCPGRFTLARGVTDLTVKDIAGIAGVRIEPRELISNKVPDKFVIAEFETGGGLISYVKKEDGFLHTLNDEEGWVRKLKHLEIVI